MGNIDLQDIIIDSIIEALSEEVKDRRVLDLVYKKLHIKKVKKDIYYNVTKEIFYKLLKEKKLKLAPGFGSVFLKGIPNKEKKVFNKRTGEMEIKQVKGQQRIVYAAGDFINEFL